MRRLTILLAFYLAVPAAAQEAVIRVHPDQVISRVTRHMTGACLEDVNHEVYGGLYSQMVFGESFQEPARRGEEGVSGMWRGLRRGTAAGRFALESKCPFIGRQSQRITFEKGAGEIGVENRGLGRWGLCLRAGKVYEGHVWLRSDRPAEVFVALESGDGARVHAATRLTVPGGDWQRLPFTLTPKDDDRAGRFALKLDRPGSVVAGHAFLQSGAWGRFKNLPVRRDVAEALVKQGLTVLRYGGSMVNAPAYRWKNMLGPRDRRPPYKGHWYPYSSNGWGILDFLDFCEAAGFLGIPAFNLEETPQDLADFVEYVNGPADSPWGRKRAAAGHPAPYRLRHLELGNEEAVHEHYWQRFRAVAEAVWARDPDLVLVVGDFAYNDHITDPYNFRGAPRIKSLAAHKKILDLARSRGRTVWFDVHVWNDNPHDPDRPGGGILGLRDFGAALKKLTPGASFKVCVFEENSGNHRLRRGLAHAHAINVLERSGDLVPVVCAANCLQPDRQNDNGWDQGLLFLSPCQVWGQPSYYVTQMVARHYLPRCVRADVEGAGGSLDVTAKVAKDGKVLQLQVVNLDGKPVQARIDLGGFAPSRPALQVVELAGRLEDENAAEQPRRIAPRERELRHDPRGGPPAYTFPPFSFTILRVQ